jgi:hypothetical protein
VSAIDGNELPAAPGERTREAVAAFEAALRRELQHAPDALRAAPPQ